MTSLARPLFFLIEPDPAVFLDLLFSRLVEPVDIVLIDPGTPPDALERLKDEMKPEAILGEMTGSSDSSSRHWTPPSGDFRGRVLLATGGTGGAPRFAIHDWEGLRAAARGFCRVFAGAANSLCLLPLWHVGGLMQAVRAQCSGGEVQLAAWAGVRSGELRPASDGLMLSLVPTQLERLLRNETAVRWLRGFRAIFLGGGPARSTLIHRAREAGLRLAPAYGMTETAAQVAVLTPDEFLTGRDGVGRALPHASVSIVDESGVSLPAGETGRILIQSGSLFVGYAGVGDQQKYGVVRKENDDQDCTRGVAAVSFRESTSLRPKRPGRLQKSECEEGGTADFGSFLTSDLGSLDEEGYLTVLGRLDDVINSGGEKIRPTEVEAVLLEMGLAEDVVVFGLVDEEWGEVVCAVLAGGTFRTPEAARKALGGRLPAWQIPRIWRQVERLPRNAMGKLDRSRLARLIEET